MPHTPCNLTISLHTPGVTDALIEQAAVPSPFTLLDAILEYEPARLAAARRFKRAPLWHGLESMAQAAAMHQRALTDFTRHAFLLSYDICRFTENRPLHGLARIAVALCGQSRNAARYDALLTLEAHALCACLHIGLMPYDARFQEEILRLRYKEAFTCLLNARSTSR